MEPCPHFDHRGGMPKLIADQDGSLKWPEDARRRTTLPAGTQVWLDRRDEALILLPRQPNMRSLYVEPTTACNLACRTCIRNVWHDPDAHMELETFERLIEQTRAFPQLKRVVLGGLGEPLTHPHFLDMIYLAGLSIIPIGAGYMWTILPSGRKGAVEADLAKVGLKEKTRLARIHLLLMRPFIGLCYISYIIVAAMLIYNSFK